MLDYFVTLVNGGDTSEEFKEAYDAYTVLARFDDLLSQHAPFITVNPKYKSDSPYTSERRYKMADLSVKQFQSFSLNEYMDASDSISMISKIILKNIPEISKDGKEYGAVGISGWMSVMSKLRMAITDSDFGTNYTVKVGDREVPIVELSESELRDKMQKVISAFITYLENTKSQGYAPHKTYLLGKLRGISKYVFARNMPTHFKAMFTHMMMKTVPSSYVSYVFNEKDGNKTSYITERPVMLQRNFLSDTVNGAAAWLKQNNAIKDSLLNKYGVKVGLDGVHIEYTDSEGIVNRIKLSLSAGGKLVMDELGAHAKWLNDNIQNIVRDILQLRIPEDFEEISKVYLNSSETLSNTAKCYFPLVAAVLRDVVLNTSEGVNFQDSQDAAKVLAVINGSETINVINNLQGNSMPLYQIQCLAYNQRQIAEHVAAQSREEQAQSWAAHNLASINISNIRSPKIRIEMDQFGKVVSTATLDPQSIMHLGIGYDFLMPLLRSQSNEEGVEKNECVIGLQAHCYADKSKHLVQQYVISKE